MAGISETVLLRVKNKFCHILLPGYSNIYKNPPKSELNAKISNDHQTIRMAGISETLHLRLKRLKFGPIMVIAIYREIHFKVGPTELGLYYYNSGIYFKI